MVEQNLVNATSESLSGSKEFTARIKTIQNTAREGYGQKNKKLKTLPRDIRNKLRSVPGSSLAGALITKELQRHPSYPYHEEDGAQKAILDFKNFFRETVHIDPDDLNYPWGTLVPMWLETQPILDKSQKKPIINSSGNNTNNTMVNKEMEQHNESLPEPPVAQLVAQIAQLQATIEALNNRIDQLIPTNIQDETPNRLVIPEGLGQRSDVRERISYDYKEKQLAEEEERRRSTDRRLLRKGPDKAFWEHLRNTRNTPSREEREYWEQRAEKLPHIVPTGELPQSEPTQVAPTEFLIEQEDLGNIQIKRNRILWSGKIEDSDGAVSYACDVELKIDSKKEPVLSIILETPTEFWKNLELKEAIGNKRVDDKTIDRVNMRNLPNEIFKPILKEGFYDRWEQESYFASGDDAAYQSLINTLPKDVSWLTSGNLDTLLTNKEVDGNVLKIFVLPALGKHVIRMSPEDFKRTFKNTPIVTSTLENFSVQGTKGNESITISLITSENKLFAQVNSNIRNNIITDVQEVYSQLNEADKYRLSKELGLTVIRALTQPPQPKPSKFSFLGRVNPIKSLRRRRQPPPA